MHREKQEQIAVVCGTKAAQCVASLCAAEMQRISCCSRDAAEMQQRCSRDAAEMQQRCRRDAGDLSDAGELQEISQMQESCRRYAVHLSFAAVQLYKPMPHLFLQQISRDALFVASLLCCTASLLHLLRDLLHLCCTERCALRCISPASERSPASLLHLSCISLQEISQNCCISPI
jgi:hypothetical protein